MTTRTRLRALPEPKWTQSDNDLLTKWMKFLEWHAQHEGNDELARLERLIRDMEASVLNYTKEVKQDNAELKRLNAILTELKNRPRITDEELQQRYEELVALPCVAGTRVGRVGELNILIDTAPLCPEGKSVGWVEVGHEYFNRSRIYVIGEDIARLYGAYRRYYYTDRLNLGEHKIVCYEGPRMYNLDQLLTTGDLAAVIALITEHLSEVIRSRMRDDDMDPDNTHIGDIPWSGYVTDPVKALRQLQKYGAVNGVEMQIRDTEASINQYEQYKDSNNRALREARTKLRNYKSQLEALQRARANVVKDVERDEARRVLEYISTLSGVIAVKFDTDGIPVLHVRNSVVHNNKRYDLGDFELYLRPEDAAFGTTMKVRRTRCPAGGSYEQGWHPTQNRFCFGGTSVTEILDAYRRGDFGHCVNIAIGIMNSVSNGDEWFSDGYTD